MATPTLRPPVDSEIFIKEGRNSRPWLNFFRQIARLFVNMRAVPTITIADLTSQAATGITAAATTTSADADATYSANEVTLINELKADLNTNAAKLDALVAVVDALITNYNLDVTLTNQLKSAHNSIITSITE